jgi:uncharacterized protein (DUF885 family)
MRQSLRLTFAAAVLLLGGMAAIAFAAETPPKTKANGDAAFRADVREFIQEGLRMYPEWATRVGDHRFDAQVSDLSAGGIRARIDRAEKWKAKFGAIDPKTLSPQNEADREWLVTVCDGALLDAEEIRSQEKSPGMYLPISGIYAIIERDFAPLKDRMKLLAERETAELRNFDAARENLKVVEIPKVSIEIALKRMPGVLVFFKAELSAAFAGVPDGPDKKSFADANAKTTAAIEAYEKWLRDAEPKAKGDYAIGAHAYARMLADDDMVDIPLPALEKVGEGELARLQAAFRATAARIDSKRSPADVMEEISRDHPAANQVIPEVSASLGELRAFVIAHHLATIPSEVMPIVRETPPYMRATTFASMDTPGPFEKATQAYFNVTLPDPSSSAEQKEQALEFFSPPMISDIAVHEVFPGHYVQFLNNRLNPDKVRSLYYSGANAEGWALYCEQMMLDEGLHNDAPRYRLAELQMALQRACRYLVGIRMHTHGMTVAEAQKFFEDNAHMTPHGAMMEALRGTEDPGYLRYQLGKLMILKLRADVQKKEGKSFDLGRFHDEFLKQGALPIRLIRRAMLGSDGPML